MGSPARPTSPGERYERPSPRHGQRAATASSSTSRLPTISVINRQAPPQASTRDGGAVVPFNSSRRGSLHTEDQPVVISTRRVCPTCMRPFGTDQEHYGYFSDEHRPDFTPQYFRSLPLLPNVATLAIQDHDATHTTTTSATTAEPPRMRHTARPSPRRTDVVEEDPGHGAMGPPICTYVSPTGLLPSHAQAWETVRCRNDEDNEEDEAMRRQSRASTQSDGRSREATQRSNEERTPSPKPPTDFGMQGYYKRYFLEVQKLGSGSFGGVYLCQHIMEGVPLGTFALKKIPVGDNPTYLQNVLREVRILEEVKRHPNVVEYNHSWVEEAQLADFGPPVRCLFILMEYASEGSLDAYLERQGSSLSTIAVWYFFLSAVAGTAHLHEKAILHRDLKPQNLLLSGPAGKPPRVLVSDFGTAAVLDEVGYERSGGTGTLEYMAPELLECDPSVTMERYVNRHTMASDVWSLGMILYFLACDGSLPQRRPDGSVVVDVAAASSIPRPREMVELIRAMLQRDPKRRPSCHDIINSTVAQTILRSFNKSAMTEEDLLPPSLHNRSGPTVPPYSSAAPAPSKMPPSIAMPQIALEDKLESSRVELLNTTVVDDPLLLQYMRQNGHGSPNRVQAPDDSPTGFQGGRLFPKRHRISSPTPSLHLSLQRPRMVDGACQTDPVRFAE